MLPLFFILAAMPQLASAQELPNQPIWNYTLLKGSELIIECPVCALAPVPLPMQGTFALQAVEFTPGFALYAVTNIAFVAENNSAPLYQLTGAGTYQAPGLPSFGQEMSLDLQIGDQTGQSECFFTNSSPAVTVTMPVIAINLDQTNGTAAKVYQLKILAAPVPRFVSITPEAQTGSVLLEWLSNGLPIQVEKAAVVNGPFVALGNLTTDQSFEDRGALTNQSPFFYRLRWNGP